MRIQSWNIASPKKPYSDQLIAPNDEPKNTWISVLVGPNGSKKSLILRVILEAALGGRPFRVGSHSPITPKIKFASKLSRPARVIAISGTPFDRFPRQTLSHRSDSASRYDIDENYFYLGYKAPNGATGSAHGVRTIAHHLLRRGSEQFPESAGAVFRFLGLKQEISLVLRRNPTVNVHSGAYGRTDRVGSFDENKFNRAVTELRSEREKFAALMSQARRDSSAFSSYETRYMLLSEVIDRSVEINWTLRAMPIELSFSFEQLDNTKPNAGEKGDLLSKMIAVGLVIPAHLKVFKLGEKNKSIPIIADADLSSGQFQLIFSMLGIALTAKDGCSILVDEPENSLHPEWQRSYVELIRSSTTHAKNCHIIIATHSPFIASGVDERSGNVVRLFPDESAPLGVSTAEVPLTYGWDANDVLEEIFKLKSTRATSFVDLTDSALAMVRDGLTKENAFLDVVEKLEPISAALPEQDPMRIIVSALVEITRGSRK